MALASLDKIVRSVLLEKALSIHFYFTYLVYARNCLRELSFDCLKAINYELLTVDEWNESELPCSFQDEINVGFEVGQYVRPLVNDNRLNQLINYDDSGNRISFNQAPMASTPRDNYLIGQENINYAAALRFGNGWNYYSVDDYGEYLGRNFGYRTNYSDTYTIIKERNVIKINEDIGNNGKFVLTYISDGSDCNAATQVNKYAIATIEAFIKWKAKENNRSYSQQEVLIAKQEFKDERKILVGRLSDIKTTDDILRSMQMGYFNAPSV